MRARAAIATVGMRAVAQRRLTLAILVAVALALRLAAVADTPDYRPLQDSVQYDRIGVSIAHGHGFPNTYFAPGGGPSAFRPPAYPYLLAGVYALSGDSRTAGRVVGCALGAVSVLLMYVLAAALWGPGLGLLAAAIAAVFPPLVLLSVALNSEVLFVPFELAAICAAVLYRQGRGGTPLLVAAGAACGLAALTRPNGWILVVPLVWAVWLRSGGLGRRLLGRAAVVLLAAAVVVAPWSIRNTVVFHSFEPLNTAAGVILAGEYNDTARDFPRYPGTWLIPYPTIVPEVASIYRGRPDEAQLDRKLMSHALRYMLDHPGYVAKASALNALRTFDLAPRAPSAARVDREQRGVGPRAADLDKVSVWLSCLLSVAGVVALSRRAAPPVGLYVWITPILLVATAFLVLGQDRYRAPILPFLVVLASLGIAWLVRGPSRSGAVAGYPH
ncbi:MAG TPA: glycosyltransferase family 39 protein [Solirubrobacteraceae bacterium]|nr:glycosyltransferase family 39 protein [Solirubrobacteraceae bacterium]